MNTEEQNNNEAVSEPVNVETEQHEEPKMVPLAALQAERRKRQEYETRTKVYEEMMDKKNEPVVAEDPEALVTRGSFHEARALTKREILEQVFQDSHPDKVEKINTYLTMILDKKPWLAASVDSATNRLARASEIIDDYMHLVEMKPKSNASLDAARIVDNARKPRSPVETGKSAQPSGTEYLKSIQGKKEFREYRQKILRGEA